MNITLNQAEKIVKAAKEKAKQIGVPMNIAIVDEGANLKTFYRMDGALLGCGDIAIKKAKTSRFFDMDSGEMGKLSQPGSPLFNIEHSNGGLISFAGGILLKNNQGGTIEEDYAVAKAGSLVL
jgi:uncharacterized protein GlcG (DUF336 family)